MNILITMGDPAGIGPEIILKALSQFEENSSYRFYVIGDSLLLKFYLEKLNIRKKIYNIKYLDDYLSDGINVIEPLSLDLKEYNIGEVSKKCGFAAYSYIKKGVELCRNGFSKTLVTGPIHKESFKAAEVPYIGHTEVLSGLTGVKNPLTLFLIGDLRIFFFTRHLSLINACLAVKKKALMSSMRDCCISLKSLGLAKSPLAVAALNPHGGENGLFGDEEINEIIPAIEEVKKEGFSIIGPIPADSVFHLAKENKWGGVLSLYHDQGHIAAKTLNFYQTISLTLKLPFLRVSVDHGTAFDISGKGIANEKSMMEALKVSMKYTINFNIIT